MLLRAAALAATVLSVAQGHASHYEALGLQEGANEIDVQVTYKATLNQFSSSTATAEELHTMVEAQKAYEALSDFEMREEALGFIKYWEEVTYLSSDDELRRFAELQVGGSARLRVIFVVARPDTKNFEAFGAAVRLAGRAKVAQLCHKNMLDQRGGLSKFYASLKVFEGGVILFDPVSRASKITYETSGVGADMERLLGGDTGTSKLARVQELDTRVYATRCGNVQGKCSWSLVVATDSAFEQKRNEVAKVLKEFTDACKSLQVMEKYPWLACFWLRMDRSPEWRDFVKKHSPGPLVEGKPVAFAMRRNPLGFVVSPSEEAFPENIHTVQLTSPESARWSTFDGAALVSVGLCRFFEKQVKAMPPDVGPLPNWPQPLQPTDEPKEPVAEVALRMYNAFMDCIIDQTCVINVVEQALIRVGVTAPDSMDTEKKTMIVGTGIASLMLAVFVCRKCCCCSSRRPMKISDEEILRNMHLVLRVPLSRRSKDEKFGLGLDPDNEGGLTINDVNPGGLVGRWNSTQPREAQRVQKGDRIIAVTYTSNGKEKTSTKSSGMTVAFREDNLVLTVSAMRGETEMKVLAGTVSLTGIDLKKDLEFVEVIGGKGGMEITKISETIQKRNADTFQRGACMTQRIEVGDRIVLSRTVEVLQHVVVAKLRFPDEVRSHTFDAVLERKDPNDKLGMQVRQFPGSPKHMEVLDILGDGMVAKYCSQSNEKVMRGDRLIAANGKDGAQNMGTEFRADRIVLRFERWTDFRGTGAPPGGAVEAVTGAAQPATATAPAMEAAPFSMVAPAAMMAPAMPPAAATAPTMAPMMPPSATMAPAPVPAAPAPAPQMMAQHFPTTPQPGFIAAPVTPSVAPQFPAAGAAVPLQSTPTFAAPLVSTGATSVPAVAASGSSDGGICCCSLIVVMLFAAVAGIATVYGNRPPLALVALARKTPEAAISPMPPGTKNFLDMIHPGLYGDLGLLFICVGVVLTIYFLSYEVSMLGQPQERRMLPQLCVASLASSSLGFGSFFMLVWAGIYI